MGNLVHDGAEIFVASTGQLLVCGNWSGSGDFTGNGRVDFEMGVQPGGTGTPSVSFEGDVNFGSDVQAAFQIGGFIPGAEFDRMQVDDDLTLDGSLNVTLVNGFSLQPGMQFIILQVGGVRTGTFDGLAEGALIGNFGGIDLLITYNGGDGNDVALIAEDSVLIGDVNFDGQINLLDVGPFVTLLTTSQFQAEPDINGDGNVNLLDVGPFVALLTGG